MNPFHQVGVGVTECQRDADVKQEVIKKMRRVLIRANLKIDWKIGFLKPIQLIFFFERVSDSINEN